MIWSFRTNGNYVDFVHTEETSLRDEEIVFHLHNTSRCISWSLPEDTTRISFTIDEVKYSDILITDIDFDGTAMNEQADFATGIEAMFPGLAGGGEEGGSYLVYTALLTQAGTANPTATTLGTNSIGAIVWTRDSTGFYIGTLTGAFPANKTWFSITCEAGTTSVASLVRIDDNQVGLENFFTIDGVYQDEFTNKAIEIRVYP